MVSVYVHGDINKKIVLSVYKLITGLPFVKIAYKMGDADLVIFPLLREILDPLLFTRNRFGALIFHPSLLPMHRGGDAIKAAFRKGAYYSGLTWFWLSGGKVDSGDIAIQSAIKITAQDTPKTYYEDKLIPEAVRTLSVLLNELDKGFVRRLPQVLSNGTFEMVLHANKAQGSPNA